MLQYVGAIDAIRICKTSCQDSFTDSASALFFLHVGLIALHWCPPSFSAGLQPMLPYLVPLLADEVGRNLGDAEQLEVVLR